MFIFLSSDVSELPQTVAPITEERASRTLYRISLLRRLRERVLPHPSLEERLLLAPHSSELPTWWKQPDHDRQLMLGAALHGVSRTELSIFSDPQFTFTQARDEFIQNQQAPPPPPPAVSLIQPKNEDIPGMNADETEEESLLLAGTQTFADLPNTHLSHHDGKAAVQEWSIKRSKVRVEKTGEGTKMEGASDSDSESGSSSSERSGSSDESGDSEEEVEGGKLSAAEKHFECWKNGFHNCICSLCSMDVDNGLIPMMPSQDGIPPDPLRLDWPKVMKCLLCVVCPFLTYFFQRMNLLTSSWGLPLYFRTGC